MISKDEGCGNRDFLDQMARQHAGLVKSVALRLSHAYGEELDDLIQIGYIGLIKAAKRFEPERGKPSLKL